MFFLGWLLVLVGFASADMVELPSAGFAAAETVDPRFPSERPPAPAGKWARWPRTRIQQLEAERSQLLERISVLPQHDPTFLSTHLGYHSLFEEPGIGESRPPHQVVFTWPWYRVLDSIALVPAFNSREPGAYAFPKRFKIEVQDANTGEFETVVNWMEDDFPDPGLYPVFFAGINRLVWKVRITVPQVAGESGAAYYALGEIYLLQTRPDGSTGANMAAWGHGHVEIEESGSFSIPPLWDIEYLADGVTGLGFPLSDEKIEATDLIVTYGDEEPLPNEVQITLDLGQAQKVGRVDFWPAAAPHLLALPSFGFPREITMELSEDPEFKTVKRIESEDTEGNMRRENLLSVATEAYRARYLRVTMKGLQEYKGKRILGLGEIWVSEYERPLALNCKVTAQGIPEEYMDQLSRLVDGCSWQRRILPQGEWIKGLARRRPLDRRLAVVERELALARADWQRVKQRTGVWSVGVIVACLIGGLAGQRQMRRRSLNKLRWRITRDLHDDVGSNLGGISLASEHLKNTDVDAEIKEELFDLSLMAREAWASLREVIWVADESTVRLPALIQKLIERAERVLSGVDVDVDAPPDFPDYVVPLPIKRHLMMLFKEVVHNCARHAQATRVWLAFSLIDRCLRISVRDNGCGFDPAEQSEGLGLDSIRNRVEEMNGKLELLSRHGEGTTVVLMLPLKSLRNKADHFYKTSN